MKIVKKIFISALALMQAAFAVSAESEQEKKNRKGNEVNVAPVAGCTPATRLVYLEFNNVRTRIEAGGIWWQDRANGAPDYEVPKNSDSYAIYAGGLWMAGTDVNGQLKAAVSRFGTGTDYWTGPLDVVGTAEINEETCEEYNKFFDVSRQDVAEFVLYNRAVLEGTEQEVFPSGYTVPQSIKEWPANGDVSNNQAPKLAPFVDVNNDNFYDSDDGDYPYFDLDGTADCRAPRINRSESATRPLFGDQTYWWIFNDKGNLHTESNAPSIGMEIHGQAFAFATNDEINDMTFYNFELINRSTFTLTDTYFASYVDPDLGNFADDYVGCDVVRGLGYCYNGDEFDESVNGNVGYGSTPAAIGIDFFEGPYQDADGINNEVGTGPGEALNGLGYTQLDQNGNIVDDADSLIDNERFGMRRFVYYTSQGGQNGEPNLAIHYYNYMRGIWQNGQAMRHGGDGLNSTGVEDIPTTFMFPGTSDPLHWGTTVNGVTTVPTNLDWTEDKTGGGQAANPPGDRRFLQSAGPFTLEPGNVNDITVGVVFAQAETGGRLASVEKLISADDKAQALFDNCFKVLDGPDAPDLTIQELDGELILYLTNGELSNNINEAYEEEDPNIVTPDTVEQILGRKYDNKYRFQGYQIFQVSNDDISVSQLDDLSVARLAFQCDIADNVTTLTNFNFDEGLQANIPITKVVGENVGIRHSFKVTDDLFASGQSALVNYKTYYYIAIAYAYNNYKRYAQDVAPSLDNPLSPASDGQKIPYLASRKNSTGGTISSVAAIPHNTIFEANGTVSNSSYGDLVGITRMQGSGNGNNAVSLTDETLDRIMEEKAWENPNESVIQLDYRLGQGPIQVQIVDPLNVIDGEFVLKMSERNPSSSRIIGDSAEWKLYLKGGGPEDTIFSERTIATRNEQLLFSPRNWGMSVLIEQGSIPGVLDGDNLPVHPTNGFLGSSITFEDPTRPWLSGINDQDVQNPQDWILSGVSGGGAGDVEYGDRNDGGDFIDPNQDFENILEGTLAPYNLVGYGFGPDINNKIVNKPGRDRLSAQNSRLEYLNSFTMVLTRDKSKWSRCPVLEMQEETDRAIAGDAKYNIRSLGSVDKEGNQWQPGMPADVTDPNSPAYIDSIGMGWFPGYVINMETGERLNVAFGEDSWFGVDNGADMIWNPTTTINTGVRGITNRVWGGKHVIYIFRKSGENEGLPNDFGRFTFRVNEYDGAKQLVSMMRNAQLRPFAWRACSWVSMPRLQFGQELLSNDVRIDVQVSRPFEIMPTDVNDTTFSSTGAVVSVDSSLENAGYPVYTFKTDGVAVSKGNTTALSNVLEEINIVPNPYYAISEYEQSAIDNLVKLVNLPENCNIKIYNMSGTLVRSYTKADPLNYLDWDLKNSVGIPLASGVYIIHVEVPNVGEKIIKWFGVMRPVDLNNF